MLKLFKLSKIAPQLPNLLFRAGLDFQFELLPFSVQKIPWKKRLNFFIAALNQYFLPARPWGYPVVAQVEPANRCNLNCSLCLTTSVNQSRPGALLSLEHFKQFIDEVGDYLLVLILWNWGEPFLNRDIFKMIEYATAKNIVVHSSTNGNLVFTEEMAAQLVDSRLTSLIVAVDGATQETYQKYRQGGDLNRVQETIRTLLRVRHAKGSKTPRITLRFVAMKQNEAELPLVKKMAEELGVDYFAVKSVDMPSDIGTSLDEVFTPKNEQYQRYEYEKGTYIRKEKPFVCMRPWKRVTMDATGEIISCEYDYKNLHSFGAMGTTTSVLDAWKGKVAAVFRHQFNKGNNSFYHCVDCSYKNIQGEECNLYAIPLHDSQ